MQPEKCGGIGTMKFALRVPVLAIIGLVYGTPVASAAEPTANDTKARAESLEQQMRERRRYAGLSAAARDNKLDRLRELVRSKDIDVNWRPNGTGVTALMTAANQGYWEAIDILIAAGADPAIEMWNGWTALAFAAQNGKTDAVKRLLTVKPAPKVRHIQLALFAAARNGRPATSTVLVKSGGRLDGTDGDGLTPLHLAAKWGQPKTVERLLQLGAAIDARDRDGRKALLWAAWQGHEKIVDVLQSAGADTTVKNKQGATAFGNATTAEQRQALLRRHWSRMKPTPKACPMVVGNGIVWRSPDGARVNGYGLYRRPATGTSAWLIPNDDAAPYGIFPGAIESAIDTDGDGRPDVLSLDYCCKDPSRASKCDYTCGSYWQRSGGAWRMCQAWNPA